MLTILVPVEVTKCRRRINRWKVQSQLYLLRSFNNAQQQDHFHEGDFKFQLLLHEQQL